MNISSVKFSRELLFLFIAIYFFQGSLYPIGSVVAKAALLFIWIISFFYLIKSLIINSGKGIFYYAWILLFLLNFVGYIFQGAFGGGFGDIYFSQLRAILTVILPFFPFYYFAYKGFISNKQLLRFFIIMLPIAIASFYSSRSHILLESLSTNENVVTNTAYFFVALIPYVFLWGKRKVFSIISLVILLFFIIQSAKRGALIVGVVSAIVFVYYQLTTVDPKKRIQSFIISIVGILLLIGFSYEFYISNDFLISRLERTDDIGSGRDIIYLNLWNNWFDSNNIFNYLFGFGFVSTIKYSGLGLLAHNDWLELLTNFGLLGISTYLFLFFAAIYFIFHSNAEREGKVIMSAIILSWFFQTLFSMYYTNSTAVLDSILLGYLFGTSHRNRISKKRTVLC